MQELIIIIITIFVNGCIVCTIQISFSWSVIEDSCINKLCLYKTKFYYCEST
jgi:hypothetical protein